MRVRPRQDARSTPNGSQAQEADLVRSRARAMAIAGALVVASPLALIGLFAAAARVGVIEGPAPSVAFVVSAVTGLAGAALAALTPIEPASRALAAWRAVCMVVGLLVGGYATAVVLLAVATGPWGF